MILEFAKMHGCGNDYIYVNGFTQTIPNPSEASVKLSDRHFSIGGDGLIMVCPSDVADAKMKMYNADGSEGKMCGNGIRCVAKFVHDNGICDKDTLRIETLSGVKAIRLFGDGKNVNSASVDMGKPEFSPELIPVKTADSQPVINRELLIGGKKWTVTCVSMGNPHCVIFVPADFDLWGFDIEKEGRPIECDAVFPEKVNVEFVKKTGDNSFEMRVWERGSGETFACGTGACATVAAAVKNGLCAMDADISVKLRGGTLTINYSDDGIKMTGEAVTAFCGRVEI